jgi:hypothetical protein
VDFEIAGIVAQGLIDFEVFTESSRTESLFARKNERRRQNSDHLVRFAIHQNLAADDGGVGPIPTAPDGIGEDDDLVLTGLIFLIGETAAQFRLYTEDGKNRGRNDGAADLLGLSAAGEIEERGLGDADVFETGDLLAPLRVDGNIDRQRGIGLEQLGCPLGEGDEALGMGEIGRPQDAVDQ